MLPCRSLLRTAASSNLISKSLLPLRIQTQNLPIPITISIRKMATTTAPTKNRDINNTSAERARVELAVDPSYARISFAIPASEDDAQIREKYRPFLLDSEHAESDWISKLELSTVAKMVEQQVIKVGDERLRVLVLYGSLRGR